MERISFHLLTHNGSTQHVYTLGRGPCGKVVKELRYYRDGAWLVIVQTHDDDTFKEFSYPSHLLLTKVTAE